jgi:nucleoside-diphosphate-sugar epimerase
MEPRRALVTGATGFVGSNLCSYLAATGADVTAIYRDSSLPARVETLRGWGVTATSFRTHSELRELVRAARPDVVFHLAAHQTRGREEDQLDTFLESNIALGATVLDAVAGTGAVFLNAASYFQFRDSVPAAFSLYSATKQAFMEIARFYRDRRAVDVRDVVLFDNFGAGDPRDKLINQLLVAARDDRELTLGPARQPINALYIDDLCAGLMSAAENGNPTLMTVRAVVDASVGEIVGDLEKVSGRPLRATFDDSRQPHDMVENAGSWPVPLGWEPRYSLASGLEATWRAFNDGGSQA